MVPGATKGLGDSNTTNTKEPDTNKGTDAKHNNSRSPRKKPPDPSAKHRSRKSKDHFEVTVKIDRHVKINEPKYNIPRKGRSRSPAKKGAGDVDKPSEPMLPIEAKEREKEKKKALKEAGLHTFHRRSQRSSKNITMTVEKTCHL